MWRAKQNLLACQVRKRAIGSPPLTNLALLSIKPPDELCHCVDVTEITKAGTIPSLSKSSNMVKFFICPAANALQTKPFGHPRIE